MLPMPQSFSFLLVLACSLLVAENTATENKETRATPFNEQLNSERIHSPMLEVLVHLPKNFRDVRSFENSLKLNPDRTNEAVSLTENNNSRNLKHVRSYEFSQKPTNNTFPGRRLKREADQPILEKPESQKLTSPTAESGLGENYSSSERIPVLPLPDAIRAPVYSHNPVKEFDIVDIDDGDYPKRRKNDSTDGREDPQRDKRTFEEGGGEMTTSLPFWKRKKESPPFVTGRGSASKGNEYSPPQHRSSLENARESHSLKNLESSVQSNEISGQNQDNYYSSTNRRTYSRQSDSSTVPPPKSVYDTIDYSKRKYESGNRNGFGPRFDDRREVFDDGPYTHEQYTNQRYTYNYPAHDRSYYQPPYQYPSEVAGRGVEYYHRTYEPNTGRIVYYATMPDNARSLDYQYMDQVNRNFYVNRPYTYDQSYRNYVPPYDYRYPMMSRQMDYMRSGRSNFQTYSYPYQEKYQRDPSRFAGGYDNRNRYPDDVRNRTYIIYDADDDRSQYGRSQFRTASSNRLEYSLPVNNYQEPYVPYRQHSPVPSVDYYSQPGFQFRNQYYQPSPPMMNWRQEPPRDARWQMYNHPNSKYSNLDLPEVQLPLTAANRNLISSREFDHKNKKS